MNPELSVVMPCLNEERTVAVCIDKAFAAMKACGVEGEVIVADNASTDRSVEIARAHGARVIDVAERGYGAALRHGISAARGTYVIMGDADDSYDFSNFAPFLAALRAGDDLVMGNRFAGGIERGAMPWHHRYLGNPVLSFIGRLFFDAPIGDFHCGLRGFNRERILALDLTAPGMEFASEMVVKASLAGYRISEVPTTLVKDGRDRAPHLRSFRDGWRHLQFLLLYSPRWLFFYPGLVALVAGVLLSARLAIGPIELASVTLDIHSLLYVAALAVIGLQMLFFAVLVRLIGMGYGRLPQAAHVESLVSYFTLERGLVVGVLMMAAGLVWTGHAVWEWGQADFSNLDPTVTMRHTIPAVALLIMGSQTVMSSFFLAALQRYQESRTRPADE